MSKKYLIVYESSYGDIFKVVREGFANQKEALKYFKENNAKYGYRVIAIREVTSDNIYLT